MPIIRGKHQFDDQFTQIPNAWLRDKRLSLKAIGLLAQLLSHSPGWSISIAQLARHNDCGLDLIRNAVKELETCGYLERSQKRVDNKFAEAIWRTKDPSGFPSSAFPSSGNPTPKNNNDKNNNLKKYGDWFDEFWDAYPRKIGKATAEKAFLKLGEDGALALAGARRLANDPNLPPAQYIPHPTTWLNRAGWQDEPYAPREKSREDLAVEAKAKSERERIASAEFLAEQARIAEAAAPPPKCAHDRNPALCRECLNELAKGKKDD
jgi:hypothetical protein